MQTVNGAKITHRNVVTAYSIFMSRLFILSFVAENQKILHARRSADAISKCSFGIRLDIIKMRICH
jgi:hypothetical protein